MNQWSTASDIRATRSSLLSGVKVALCVTGSAAAYKAIDLARTLIRHGADVVPVLTREAARLVSADLFQWATGNEPVTTLSGKLEHVQLGGGTPVSANIVVVAPATAATISRAAHGDASGPVLALINIALGAGKPVVFVPAMHEEMYDNPAVRESLAKLESMGVTIVPPVVEEGKAKIPPDYEVLEAVISSLRKKSLKGVRILVTAGPTVERIDPVRVITNLSSGKMGAAIAWEALARGAEVSVVHGPVSARLPRQAHLHPVLSTEEMAGKVAEVIESWKPDAMIAVAAVADYKVEKPFPEKVPTERGGVSLRLVPTPKVVDVATSRGVPVLAFRAVYGKGSDEDLALEGREYMRKHPGVFAVAVNDVSEPGMGFGSDHNRLVLVSKTRVEATPPLPKRVLAVHVLDFLERELPHP